MVPVNYRRLCMQSSKDMKDSPRKFVFLQSSSPDVQREGGGGKTNISLLESSRGVGFGLENINNEKTEHKNLVRRRRKRDT